MRATVIVDPHRVIGQVDPLIYGQFLSRRRWVADEALYDPTHPDADVSGLRRSVVAALAESAPTIIRWPGGCTGTSYDWRDGIGPRGDRDRTIDAHFGYDVGNGFGTAEFVEFCRCIGAEPHLNFNTGTGTLRDALEWIEYANFTTDSRWANLRREHGYPEPFGVRYWQIGNENYGPWEIGHQSPREYAVMAREWAKAIKKLDSSLQVLAVGGSEARSGSPAWDVAVLEEAWEHIDYLTAHRYWDFNSGRGVDNYDAIAGTGYLEEQTIRSLSGLIDLIAREKRSARRPMLAFTEWNARDQWQKEMSDVWHPVDTQYRLVDALAAAGFLNALQRQCNVVGLATVAQSINVVGLLFVTPEALVRETVYWACLMQRRYSGATAVDAVVECDGYTAQFEDRSVAGVPYLDVSATLDATTQRLFLSLVNRHRTDELVTCFRLRDTAIAGPGVLHQLWHDDPLARNTRDAPDAVAPTESALALSGADLEVALPPHSYSIIEVQL